MNRRTSIVFPPEQFAVIEAEAAHLQISISELMRRLVAEKYPAVTNTVAGRLPRNREAA